MPERLHVPPELRAILPSIPADASGPVFRQPWEAQAFAVVVSLHRSGCFTWPEWVEVIGAEIVRSQSAGDPGDGANYYHHWLAALEAITTAKGMATEAELRLRRLECALNDPPKHDHAPSRDPIRID